MSEKTDEGVVDATADTVRCTGGHQLEPSNGLCSKCGTPWSQWERRKRSSRLFADKTDAYDARPAQAGPVTPSQSVQLVGRTVVLEPLWASRLQVLAQQAQLDPGAYLTAILRQHWESTRRDEPKPG